MPAQLQKMLEGLRDSNHAELLKAISHGIEKEGLRVSPEGQLSQADHPVALGSALTHPRITTDYSEALLEFITPVFQSVEQTLDYLEDLHRYSYSHLDSELIWGASMPSHIEQPSDIPIARYGSSNSGQMKHIYRLGLEARYGRVMQSIAGIHYNFSLPAEFWPLLQQLQGDDSDLQTFQSQSYFALLRNFRRHGWLLIYLFGASPALDRSFVDGSDNHQLEEWDGDTLYGRYATSLRMSDLGYTNQAQASLNICYNHLDNYVQTLAAAVATPYPAYEALGLRNDDGGYRQLNTNLLQIENEYYSDIRPKRVTQRGEKPLHALQRRGVEYIEIRSQDINPLTPLGIDAEQARLIDCFLLHCLLSASPDISGDECERLKLNQNRVVRQGRQPGLQLLTEHGERSLSDWGLELLDQLQQVAELMDQVQGSSCYSRAVQQQRGKLIDPELTPSAQVLALMRERGQGHCEFVIAQSQLHRQRLLNESLKEGQRQAFDDYGHRSLVEQQQLEQQDALSLDQYLANYFAD